MNSEALLIMGEGGQGGSRISAARAFSRIEHASSCITSSRVRVGIRPRSEELELKSEALRVKRSGLRS